MSQKGLSAKELMDKWNENPFNSHLKGKFEESFNNVKKTEQEYLNDKNNEENFIQLMNDVELLLKDLLYCFNRDVKDSIIIKLDL